MQRQGVHPSNIVFMFTTIQKLSHTVRTEFGDSDIKFTQEVWLAPLRGVGQGNGAGPAIWAVVSTPVLDLLRDEGVGAAFNLSLSGKVIKVLGYSFVDDTDLVVGGNYCNHDNITAELQRSLDLWQTGIEATGGALVPEKSFWSEVSFAWDIKGKWSYSKDSQDSSNIIMKDTNNEEKILRKIGPNEAIETLGVHLTPNGNDEIQFQVMKEKSIQWANKIKSAGRLSRQDVWTGLRSTILKTLEYPLPVTCLTKDQCTKIMYPILEVSLPGVGISRKFLRNYIHGPPECFGLDVPSLFTYQGASHIDLLVTHWKEESTTSQLLRSSMESLQVEIGLEGNPLNINFQIWSEAATPCWLTSTWEFMSQYEIKIDLELKTIPLRQVGDKFLMEQFISHGAKKSDSVKLNRCRLFLKVMTFADICNANGDEVVPEAWIGSKLIESRKKIEWPVQGRPDEISWRMWRSFLRKILTLTNKHIPVNHQLGPWIETPDFRSWKWFYDPQIRNIYQKHGSLVILYYARSLSDRNKTYTYHSVAIHLPITFKRCTVKKMTANKIRLQSIGKCIPQTLQQRSKVTLPIEMEVDNTKELDIIEGLKNGTVIAVSDGSLKSSFGTGAIILFNTATSSFIRGCVISYGGTKDQSAYRSELIGLAAIITYVTSLVTINNLQNVTIEVACDGISALQNVFDEWNTKIKTTMKHYDVIAYARSVKSQSAVKWSSRYVYGHQDKVSTDLSIWERLNVVVDKIAAEYWDQKLFQYNNAIPLSDGFPTLSIDGIAVCSKLTKTVQQRTNFAD